MIRSFKGREPRIGQRVFVDPSAQVVGDVELGDDVSIWMGAVLRGDINAIRVGARSNIQDNAVIHVDFGDEFQALIGEEVTVGHAAVLHGCRIGPRCLIGMSATVLSGARIADDCVVAAGSLVLEGFDCPERSLVMGSPARVKRALTEDELARLKESAAHYVAFKDDFLGEEGGR